MVIKKHELLNISLGLIISVLGIVSTVEARGRGVTLTTNSDEYQLGDDIVITMSNNDREPIYYNGLCSLNHCEENNGQWKCEMLDCQAPQEVLSPGEEREYKIRVLGLLAGNIKYKLDYSTAILEKDGVVYSNTFFVKNIRKGGPSSGLTKSAPVVAPKSAPVNRRRDLRIDPPVARKEINPKIISISKNGERTTNRYRATKFKNQNRPSNQEIIRQRKRQDSRPRKASGYNVTDTKIVLSVSGVDEMERGALAQVLAEALPSVEAIEQIYYDRGNIQYYVELNVDTVTFSEELEDVGLATLRLDVIRMSPGYIDCVLRTL